MFTHESVQYLSTFKEFLVEQQSKEEDPRLAVLIAEIDREILKRTEYTD